MVWLRVEKRCMIVTRERTLLYGAGQPDVMGITKERYVIEIEIKRSVSDFRADAKKISRQNRVLGHTNYPKQFYYLMPKKIADKVENEIPHWAGLMNVAEDGACCVVSKRAPTNERSERVTIRQCARAVEHQTNFILSLERELDNWKARFIEGHQPYIGLNPELHFEI